MTTYDYHDEVAIGGIHIPHDLEYANQGARLAESGLASKHIGRFAVQTDDNSIWRCTAVAPSVTWGLVAPPEPVVGDVGKVSVIESDGAGGVRADWQTWTVQKAYEAGSDITLNATGGEIEWTIPDGYYFAVVGPGGVGTDFFACSSSGSDFNLGAASDSGTFQVAVGGTMSLESTGGSVNVTSGDAYTLLVENDITIFAGQSANGSLELTSAGAGWTQFDISYNDTNYGVGIENGADYVRVINSGADQIEFSATVQTMSLVVADDYTIDGAGISELTLINDGACTLYSHTGYGWDIQAFGATTCLLTGNADWTTTIDGAGNIVEDLSQMDDPNGGAYRWTASNGADYFSIQRKGTDLADMIGTLQAGNLTFSTTLNITNTGTFTIDSAATDWNLNGVNETTSLVYIKQTPSSGTVNTICTIEADGTNWSATSNALKIISDDNSCWNLNIHDGSNDRLLIGRTGAMWMYGAYTENMIDFGYVGGTAEAFGGFRYSQDDGLLFLAGKSGYGNHNIVVTSYANSGSDHDHADHSTNPSLFVHSALDPDTDNTEYGTIAYNHLGIGVGNGGFAGVKWTADEEVTISVGNGSGGVNTSGNLAPADSLILGAIVRVTQAPGGGATTLDVGVTAGDTDALIDGISTAVDTTGNTPADGNSGAQMPIANGSATTLVLTTDLDVTGSDMKVRVAVCYLDFTAFAS